MFDLDWAQVAAFFTVVTVIAGWVVWIIRSEGRSRANEAAIKAAEKRIEEAKAEGRQLRAEFSTYREEVAKNYVTFAFMRDMEERILKQIDRVYEAVTAKGH